MKPSNPATFWLTGSDVGEFHFRPGRVLHYAVMRSKSHIPISMVLMADNKDHVKRVLLQMCQFRQDCQGKYSDAFGGTDHPSVIWRKKSQDRIFSLLFHLANDAEEASGYSLEIGEADTTQVFKAGWARNDTW